MSFECVECGYPAVKWLGRCPACQEWDTFVEVEKFETGKGSKTGGKVKVKDIIKTGVQNLSDIESCLDKRTEIGLEGLDRLLGGGIVEGQVLLFGGPPGVGKSTMFLQIADRLGKAGKKVLYISGEENPGQIKVHAERLGIRGGHISVVGTGDLSNLNSMVEELEPDIVFVDSVQAVVDSETSGLPGSLKQVKQTGQILTAVAKNTGVPIFASGQITKQGDIAGPKVLEHMVDAVFYMDYLEGDKRILNAAKNRFGSCGDFVIYVINEKGLGEIDEFADSVSRKDKRTVGQIGSCIRVGKRLMFTEFQVLASNSYFEYPLRRTSGFSRERLLMLTAIAEKYLNLKLGTLDIYLNVIGGHKVLERTSDLAVIGALYSGLKNIPVSNSFMFFGEVSLNGDVRPLQDVKERVNFAARNNFKKVICSAGEKNIIDAGTETEVVYIRNIKELNNIINMKGE
jgi:DNA repair protein RadA/Sms